jgi:chromosome segregation ATPase
MRSLQEKIKWLERENEELRLNYEELEEGYLSEKERWQHRLLNEVGSAKEKAREVYSRDEALSTELKRAQQSLEEFKDKFQIAEGRIRLLENEHRRAGEQASIERENLNLQLINTQRKLEAAEEEVRDLKTAVQRHESNRGIQLEELLQAENLISSLKDELSYLRDHSEQQRTTLESGLAATEVRLAKQNTDYEQQLRQMEVKYTSSQELLESHRRQIEYLKQELAELQAAKEEHEEAREKLVRQSHRAELVAKEAMSLNGQLAEAVKAQRASVHPKVAKRPTNKSLTPRTKKTSKTQSRPQTSRPRKGAEIDWEIRQLEDTIAGLNRQYRQMLHSSYTSSSDLRPLRVELNAIAESLEDKTRELSRLKRLQQASLKEQLSSRTS